VLLDFELRATGRAVLRTQAPRLEPHPAGVADVLGPLGPALHWGVLVVEQWEPLESPVSVCGLPLLLAPTECDFWAPPGATGGLCTPCTPCPPPLPPLPPTPAPAPAPAPPLSLPVAPQSGPPQKLLHCRRSPPGSSGALQINASTVGSTVSPPPLVPSAAARRTLGQRRGQHTCSSGPSPPKAMGVQHCQGAGKGVPGVPLRGLSQRQEQQGARAYPLPRVLPEALPGPARGVPRGSPLRLLGTFSCQ